MRLLLVALTASQSCAVHMWSRTVAIAPAATPTGLALLGELRKHIREERNNEVAVRAICRSKAEVAICRQALCGAICEGGIVRDRCEESFPALRTCLSHDASALQGVTTLIILTDDIHPLLSDVGGLGEQVVTMPTPSSYTTTQCVCESFDLIDAAAAANVGHVILHSAIGASGSGSRAPSQLQVARMGGSAHLALRRRIEDRLKEHCERSRESPAQTVMRHTILQAAPYASSAQLAARIREEAVAASADGKLSEECSDTALLSPPLTSPQTLASAAVKAALYTRPNTLRRLVTRQVISR